MATLQTDMFVGLGLVAVWAYVRYPRLRPRSLTRAIARVAVSFGLFYALPYALDACKQLPGRAGLVVFVVGLMIPSLGFVLLSWLWLMAKIHEIGNSTPRGGHRVRKTARVGANA